MAKSRFKDSEIMQLYASEHHDKFDLSFFVPSQTKIENREYIADELMLAKKKERLD